MLSCFRSGLERIYGDRLARVVLFGSRARGEARADSDYDIAVFLRGMTDRWAEFDRIEPIETELLFERGVVIAALPYEVAQYHERSSLMRDIREEGIEL
jgi:predicted nucleotidyltransferase